MSSYFFVFLFPCLCEYTGLLHSETITDITENNDASQQKPEVAPTSANLAPENMIGKLLLFINSLICDIRSLGKR
jgi:hypothetical protein